MKDCVASSAQACQIIKVLKLVPPIVITPMVRLQVVLAIANLASISSPLLYCLGYSLPVIRLKVIVVVHLFNQLNLVLFWAQPPSPYWEQAQQW
jgi:hypothetical protein